MFELAVKEQSRLLLAIEGLSGAGKTLTALKIIEQIRARRTPEGEEPGKVCIIDTENGTSMLYADDFPAMPYYINRLGVDPKNPRKMLPNPFSPDNFKAACREAVEFGAQYLIIDSLSEAYDGEGGLQAINQANKQKGDSYGAWIQGTPIWKNLMRSLRFYGCDVIATIKAKEDYEKVSEGGTTKITAVGAGPIIRPNTKYEFDVYASIDGTHTLTVTKTRCKLLDHYTRTNPGAEFADLLMDWLLEGVPEPDVPDGEGEEIAASKRVLDLLQKVYETFPRWCQSTKGWEAAFVRKSLGLQDYQGLPELTDAHFPLLEREAKKMRAEGRN